MSALDGCRIALWVEERDGRAAVNPVMQDLLAALRADGAATRVRVIERRTAGPRSDSGQDLILLKSFGPLARSLALASEHRGQRFLNGAAATVRTGDKAAVVARLAAAGLAVPVTWLRDVGLVREPRSSRVAGWSRRGWFTKPVDGVHGAGVQSHSAPVAPSRHSGSGGPELVQVAVGSGADLKVYVAGDAVFVARKAFAPGSFTSDAIERIAADPEVIRIARCAGEALELDCFGLDLRSGDDGPVIVDANAFPGFRGFPDAIPALRSLVHASLGMA